MSGQGAGYCVGNRGEIAVRVARACLDAQLTSVAVYSDPDADVLHVWVAHEAYALGGADSSESYLSIPQLLDAAERSGADAVHPGYGFLSENADVAQAVIDVGLAWVGPSLRAIRDLGTKVTARRIAVAAGAPLVPGTEGPVEDADQVRAFAEERGLPTVVPFHQEVLRQEVFTGTKGLGVYTTWIESEFTVDLSAFPYVAAAALGAERTELTVTVDGRVVQLGVPELLYRALLTATTGATAAGLTRWSRPAASAAPGRPVRASP